MAAPALKRVSVEEFFDTPDPVGWKLEYARGEIVRMVRGSMRHASVVTRVGALLDAHIRSGRCRTYIESVSVRIAAADAIRIPDVVVACPPNVLDERRGLIDNPTAIVEVASPESLDRDLGEKLAEYASLPSLKDYAVLSSEAAFAHRFSRTEGGGDWTVTLSSGAEAKFELPSLGFATTLAAIYEGLELPSIAPEPVES